MWNSWCLALRWLRGHPNVHDEVNAMQVEQSQNQQVVQVLSIGSNQS